MLQTGCSEKAFPEVLRQVIRKAIEIGTGEAEPEWARTVLEARDRTAGGVTAPPGGLYLVRVSYPERFGLP